MKEKKNWGIMAFFPFVVLIGLVLGNVIVNMITGTPQSQNGIPVLAATFLAVITSFLYGNGTVNDRLDEFTKSAADSSTMMMVLIFLLAGAFTSVSKAMGAADALVNMCLNFLPGSMIYAGILIISGLISLAIGSSVGTLTAMAPITAGLVAQTGLNINIALAACAAGAMFGDNLSMISDTTIAATKGMGCEMKDKFKMNFLMVLPAVLVVFAIYLIIGMKGAPGAVETGSYSIIKIVPYVFVIVAALAGLNVVHVLLAGIVISAIIGFGYGDFNFVGVMNAVSNGLASMATVSFTAILVKGMMGIITFNGGIDWLIQKLTNNIKSQKGAQYSIAALAGLMGALLRSTTAIIVAVPLAKQISEKYDIDPRRTASLLDICATAVNGLVFWDGVNLVITQLAGAGNPITLVSCAYYSMAILVVLFITIQFNIQVGLKDRKKK